MQRMRAEFDIPENFSWELEQGRLLVYDQNGELWGFTTKWWLVGDDRDEDQESGQNGASSVLPAADRSTGGDPAS